MDKIQKIISHGSAVAWEMSEGSFFSVLVRAKSGGGKSDLSFRLIEELGATLVADDQVVLENRHGHIITGCEESIRGLLEIRGVGLLKYKTIPYAKLDLIIDLVQRDNVPRIPDWENEDILGVSIPVLKLNAFETSSALKVFKSMQVLHDTNILIEGSY